VHDDDVGRRQLQVGVQRLDGGVVPLLDLAEEDFGQDLARQLQLARFDAVDVHHGHGAADDGRELQQTVLFQVSCLHGIVRGAEIDGLGDDLLLAAARTDRLVVDRVVGGCLVVRRPLGVDGVRERCAGAGHVGGLDGKHGGAQRDAQGNLFEDTFEHLGSFCAR
jgi:hypothetical protein